MENILHPLRPDQRRRSLGRREARGPESRRLSAMCCGKAATSWRPTFVLAES